MLRCKTCNKLGLFRTIDPNSGICLECERKSLMQPDIPRTVIPLDSSVHIPRYYIGNGMRYIVTDTFEDITVEVAQFCNFSKIKQGSDCVLSLVDNKIDISQKYDLHIGCVMDKIIYNMVEKSITDKLPVFSQVCKLNSVENLVTVTIGFYRIENYDYSPEHDEYFDDIDFEDIGYC